jgi:hypothetical protein
MTVERIGASKSLLEFVDRVLEGGIVIVDRDVLLSVLGLELLALEAQVVTVSAQKYLKYAEAVGLLPLKATRHVTEYVTRRETRDREALPRRILKWFVGLVSRNRWGTPSLPDGANPQVPGGSRRLTHWRGD